MALHIFTSKVVFAKYVIITVLSHLCILTSYSSMHVIQRSLNDVYLIDQGLIQRGR